MTRDARTGTDDASPAPQPSLPFDDAADEPIGFALTARARRTVAPAALPALRVVPRRRGTQVDDPADERSDTRPARARALHRAGVQTATIARQLDVDELLVRAWTGALPAGAAPLVAAEHGTTSGDERTAFELARAAAADAVGTRLATDARFTAGLGVLVGVATVDPHAVTVVTADQEVAAAVVGWLSTHADSDPARLRVVLKVAPGAAGDVVRHGWAARLGVAVERCVLARWPGAPTPDAVEALVRLADPTFAATFAGWRDALLADVAPAAPVDPSF